MVAVHGLHWPVTGLMRWELANVAQYSCENIINCTIFANLQRYNGMKVMLIINVLLFLS